MLGPWIVENMPAHQVYVEPFGGSAGVLLQKPRSYAEVYNDADGLVVNMFKVLRDPDLAAELHKAISLTPFAREEFDSVGYRRDEWTGLDPVEKARRFLIRSYMGFGSNSVHSSSGFRVDSRKSGSTPAQDWRRWPERVPALTERLRGVVIENRCYRSVIEKHDAKDTLFYFDPPYLQDTRGTNGKGYYLDWDDNHHRDFANAIAGINGMVLISGYPHPLYDKDLFSQWHTIDREAYADSARKRVERLWFNDAAVGQIERDRYQGELFGT